MNTMVEWPRENQNPTDSGLRSRRVVGDQLAGGVVDRRDVIGVEGMAQAEGVGEHADADVVEPAVADLEVVRHDQAEQDPEAEHVQEDDEPEHAPQRSAIAPGQRRAEPGDAGGARGRGQGHAPDGSPYRKMLAITPANRWQQSSHLGSSAARGPAQSSTRDAITTVRSSGRQKYAAGVAALCARPMNSRLRHVIISRSLPRSMVMRDRK